MTDLQLLTDERFWEKVDKNGPVPIERPDLGPCWIWTRALTQAGYGAFNLPRVAGERRRQEFAHIWGYKRYVGPIPDGHQLDHYCHTVDLEHCNLGDSCPHRACVNYETHLELVTPAENTMRSRSWAATKKQQVTCLRGHLLMAPNLSTSPSDLARNAQRCKACNQTHQLPLAHKADPEFDFRAESDLTYNRIMGIIPEQVPTQHRRIIRPSTLEQLEAVEIMIRNLEKL